MQQLDEQKIYRDGDVKIYINFLGSLVIHDLHDNDAVYFRAYLRENGILKLKRLLATQRSGRYQINEVDVRLMATSNALMAIDTDSQESVVLRDESYLALLLFLANVKESD